MHNMIDTLQIARRLQNKGLSAESAEELAEILKEQEQQSFQNLATKDDIKALQIATKSDINELQIATKNDIRALQIATQSDINALRTDTKNEIAIIKKDMHLLEEKLVRRIDNSVYKTVSAIVLIAGLFKAIEFIF